MRKNKPKTEKEEKQQEYTSRYVSLRRVHSLENVLIHNMRVYVCVFV